MKSALWAFTIFGFLALAGCYNQVLLSSETVQLDTTKDIVVSTKDGRKISFSGGSYSISPDTMAQMLLEGTGRVLARASTQDEPFSGQVPFREILEIHSSEKSALYYTSIVVGAAATAYCIYLMIVLGSGRGLGG